MTLAVLCSGQGAQHAGMFDLLADPAAAAPVFAAAAPLLGADPRALVRAAGAELHANRTGQILCCTQALAAWAIIAPIRPARVVLVGYSIGDLAAWGCAGSFDTTTVLCLAALRADAMDAASGPGMALAGVRGLLRAAVDALAAPLGLDVAIINAADSFVVGGPRPACEAFCDAATAAGAQRAVVLPVHVPAHTKRLAAARAPFRAALQGATLHPPAAGIRLLSGLDGAPVFETGAGLDKLAAQIDTTIDWAQCLQACAESGADRVLELGPGHALATMARAAIPAAEGRSLEDFRTTDGLLAWLTR